MSFVPSTEETLEFRIGDHVRKAVVRTPSRMCRHPALLIALASDRHSPFTNPDGVWITPSIFLAAGHRVASFDLPNHGERADVHGSSLEGMAAAIAAGVDVFDDVRRTGIALIDLCAQRGLASGAGIVLEGVSRGGLAALHVMAGDKRVIACAVHSAMAHLPTLTEFARLEGNPIVARSNALSLVDQLADRPVFLAIGESDPRVGAAHSFELYARLSARAIAHPPELFTAPGVSHGDTFPYESGSHAGAAFLLRHVALRAKLLPFRHEKV